MQRLIYTIFDSEIIVRSVRGDLRGNCADWSKSMKFGTLVVFDMLKPNLPGTKANSEWFSHFG